MKNPELISLAEGRALVRHLSGLRDAAAPPSLLGNVLARVGLADAYWQVDSPVGRIYVAYNSKGIAAVMRAEDDGAFERAFQARFRRPIHAVAAPPEPLARRVSDRLRSGNGRRLGYDLRGLTEFERAVLLKALEIPRGEVRPYAWIAREIGHPRATRAVGSALANNPVPLLIPCHRVVRSDGHIGNYVFGEDAKRTVLKGEGVEVERLEALGMAGVRYFGSRTTQIYCYPTCRHGQRITDQFRIWFESAEDAAAAGFRPCRVCRPASAS